MSDLEAASMSTIGRVNERIHAGKAVIRTLEQLCREADIGSVPDDTDAVVLAFATGIERTAAMLCIPVTARGVFTRAREIALNGVRGHPGPAPNERLGVVDALVFAGERAFGNRAGYNGAALFGDLLKGNSIEVQCLSAEGATHRNTVHLSSLDFARFYVYDAELPAGMPASAARSGAFAPGARIVLNGSQGIVVGRGTHHRAGQPTISLAADLHDMDQDLMSARDGERPHNTVAAALAVGDAGLLSDLVAWARVGGSPLLSQTARVAASQLQDLVASGKFLLTDIGE